MGEPMTYTEEQKKCDMCGGDNCKHVRTQSPFGKERMLKEGDKIFNATDVMCMDCGLIQKNPSLTRESLNKFYQEDYLKLYAPSLIAGIPKGELLTRAIDNVYMMEWLKKNDISVKGLHILNVGSGLGMLSHFFECYGAKVDSVEPLSRASEIARKLFGIESINAYFESFETDKKYDMVVFQNSLEHFYSPKAMLSKAKSILADNGGVLIEIPDIMFPYPKTTIDAWLSSAHMYSFTQDTLWGLMSWSGYEIVKCDHAGDKGKMLVLAKPGNMVSCVDTETLYQKLFDMFREMDPMQVKADKYRKELFEAKDVTAICKDIYDNNFYNINTYIVVLAEELINKGMPDKASKLLELMPYRDDAPHEIGICKGVYYYLIAITKRHGGDMVAFKKYLDMAVEAFPPIHKYNIINTMMLNGLLSEGIMSRYFFWSAKKLRDTLQ